MPTPPGPVAFALLLCVFIQTAQLNVVLLLCFPSLLRSDPKTAAVMAKLLLRWRVCFLGLWAARILALLQLYTSDWARMKNLSTTLQYQRDWRTVTLVVLEAINLLLEKGWAYALDRVRPHTVALECFKMDMWMIQTVLNYHLREVRLQHVNKMIQTEVRTLDRNNSQHEARLQKITAFRDRMMEEAEE
jgi:hypothetical protein